MSNLIKSATFTVPLTADAYQLAQQFSCGQKDSQKAQQIRLNTLAVYAVNFYCKCMDVETELDKSDSWNSASRILMNVADLQIKDVGKLECLTVLPDAKECYVPPDVWDKCIGYVVVQIDEICHEATLLGFVKKVTNEALPLCQLGSLEDLIDCLEPLSNDILEPQHKFVRLSEWFDGLFYGGWQRKPKFAPISLSLRNADLPEVNAAKVMRLSVQMSERTVTLMIRQRKLSEKEINICLRLYPGNNSSHLPDGVKLIVLDEFGEPIPSLEVEAKADSWLQLQFTGSLGDKFSIRIHLASDCITETFVI
ncbi:DUF1822 family protein [Tolypothrix campylonemoides VB511288]|nr:DUF1822 family protein [Tolypothrix campylonemoides VB511288]